MHAPSMWNGTSSTSNCYRRGGVSHNCVNWLESCQWFSWWCLPFHCFWRTASKHLCHGTSYLFVYPACVRLDTHSKHVLTHSLSLIKLWVNCSGCEWLKSLTQYCLLSVSFPGDALAYYNLNCNSMCITSAGQTNWKQVTVLHALSAQWLGCAPSLM